MSFAFLKILKSPNEGVLELLEQNLIGTPGKGMVYQHLGVHSKIRHIVDPYYICLLKQNSIIGTCCFCRRSTTNSGRQIHSYYVRYLSFKSVFRIKQAPERKASRNSRIREEIKALMEGRGLSVKADEEFFLYAYVDPRNIRSAKLCRQFGFEAVRQYSTVIFNRINPKGNGARVEEITRDQQGQVRDLLMDFYKGFNMFSFDNLLNEGKYYVIRDQNGKILAGAQVSPEHWKILSMPGLAGNVLLHTFSYLPGLNRLINKDYHFLVVDGVYYANGLEKTLEILLETLLSMFRVNSAITLADVNSDLYKALKSLDLGLVDMLSQEVRGDVICKFSNVDDEERALFRTRPAYISGVDVT